jgi:hypothetical protein
MKGDGLSRADRAKFPRLRNSSPDPINQTCRSSLMSTSSDADGVASVLPEQRMLASVMRLALRTEAGKW